MQARAAFKSRRPVRGLMKEGVAPRAAGAGVDPRDGRGFCRGRRVLSSTSSLPLLLLLLPDGGSRSE